MRIAAGTAPPFLWWRSVKWRETLRHVRGAHRKSWPNLKVARLIFRGGIPHRDTETAGADY
jgi:hypothetical protein